MARSTATSVPTIIGADGVERTLDGVGFDPSDPVALADTIGMFAEAVGLIERMARAGDVELVTELARIAYARGRRAERATVAA